MDFSRLRYDFTAENILVTLIMGKRSYFSQKKNKGKSIYIYTSIKFGVCSLQVLMHKICLSSYDQND